MKKILFFLMLAATLIFATSCPNSETPDEPENPDEITAPVILKILAYGDPENEEGNDFVRICSEFEAANPLIDIQYECRFDEDYHHRVAERLASGDIPDIAYMGADTRWGTAWKNAGQQIDNTPYMPANIDKRLIPDFYGTGVKPYIPLGGSNFCTVIGVNMRLLEEIGGTLPTTYDEFKALAALCQQHEKKCLITQGGDDWVWGSCVMSGIIPRTTGNLKWVQDAVAGKEHFTDADFVAALDVLRQWVADGILDVSSLNYVTWQAREAFCNEEALMIINGQWEFAEQNYGDLSEHMKLIPIPPVPGQVGCAGSVAGAWQVGCGITRKGATSSDPNVLKAAKKWLTYFYSKEETRIRLNNGSITCPIITDFDYTDFNNLVRQKVLLSMYPICDVIDSYLTGDANDKLNAGMKDIVSRATEDGADQLASSLAQEVQTAFNLQ